MSTTTCFFAFRNLVNLKPVSTTNICNKEQVLFCRTDKELVYIIIFKKCCTVAAGSSPTLLFVFCNRNSFDITKAGNHYNHVLILNHIFKIYLFNFVIYNFCSAVITIFICKLVCFIFNYLKDFFVVNKQILKIINPGLKLFNLFLQIFNLQMCKTFELHINDCLSLLIIKVEAFFQTELCIFCISAGLDNLNYFINIVDCCNEGFQNMHSVFCNFKVINCAASNYFISVIYKMLDKLLECKNFRL